MWKWPLQLSRDTATPQSRMVSLQDLCHPPRTVSSWDHRALPAWREETWGRVTGSDPYRVRRERRKASRRPCPVGSCQSGHSVWLPGDVFGPHAAKHMCRARPLHWPNTHFGCSIDDGANPAVDITLQTLVFSLLPQGISFKRREGTEAWACMCSVKPFLLSENQTALPSRLPKEKGRFPEDNSHTPCDSFNRQCLSCCNLASVDEVVSGQLADVMSVAGPPRDTPVFVRGTSSSCCREFPSRHIHVAVTQHRPRPLKLQGVFFLIT